MQTTKLLLKFRANHESELTQPIYRYTIGIIYEVPTAQGSQAAGQKYRPIKLMPNLSSATIFLVP